MGHVLATLNADRRPLHHRGLDYAIATFFGVCYFGLIALRRAYPVDAHTIVRRFEAAGHTMKAWNRDAPPLAGAAPPQPPLRPVRTSAPSAFAPPKPPVDPRKPRVWFDIVASSAHKGANDTKHSRYQQPLVALGEGLQAAGVYFRASEDYWEDVFHGGHLFQRADEPPDYPADVSDESDESDDDDEED